MPKQLENTSSINDLQIAEKLELLKQFNNNNNNINNNDINNNNSNNNNDNDDNDDAPFAAPPQLPSPLFLCWLIHHQLTAMKAILKVKILFKIFFLEDLEEIDCNTKELQLQLEKKMLLQLQRNLIF